MKRVFIGILKWSLAAFILLLAIFFVLVYWPLAPLPQPIQTERSVVITDVTVINPDSGATLTGQTVVISGDRITEMGPQETVSVPGEALVISGRDKFLIPGLWDMHAHMGSTFAPRLTLPLFIASGITYLRDLGGYASVDQKKAWNQEVLAGELVGPRFMAQAGLFLASMDSPNEAIERVASIEDKRDFIKVYNQLLPDHYFALLREAQAKGVEVLGHKPRAVRAIDAAAAGHLSFEHARLFLFESYPGAAELRERYRQRYSGEDSAHARIETTAMRREMLDHHDEEMFNELVETMVEHETWFCPTHITRKMDAFADNPEYREDERLKYIHFFQQFGWNLDADGMIDRDPSPAGRQAFMEFYEKGLELTGKAHKAGVRVLAGTDANDTYCFPGLSLHDELKELVSAGLSPLAALQAATSGPAEYFGLSHQYGSVAIGYMADLVLLEANPLEQISNTTKIDAVVFAGNVYHRQDLENLLAYVESQAASLSLGCKLFWKAVSN